MPLFIWLVLRVARALSATLRLLTNPRVLRGLPWPYIRRLPRRDRWVGLLTITVPLTALGAVVVAVAPSAGIRPVVGTVGFIAGAVGVVSSGIRSLARR